MSKQAGLELSIKYEGEVIIPERYWYMVSRFISLHGFQRGGRYRNQKGEINGWSKPNANNISVSEKYNSDDLKVSLKLNGALAIEAFQLINEINKHIEYDKLLESSEVECE